MITSAKLSDEALESGAEAFALADGGWQRPLDVKESYNKDVVTMIPHPLVFECILRNETERLEEFDADILSATAGDGITALQNAAALGSIDCLRILVRRLGVTTADPALFHCCDARFPFGDRQDVLELVLSLNPTLDLQSCFDSAAFFGVDWMLSFLLSSQNGESLDVNSALRHACEGGRTEIALMFLEKHGADVNSEDDVHASTPMMLASQKGHLGCVRMLLEQGADVNARTRVGWTAVAWASYYGHTDCVRFLLEHGAKLGMSLAWAAQEGHIDCCRLLIDSGADVNVQNADGQTALSLAEGRGHTDCIALLRQSGAV